jgi:hypothetical protein
MKCGADKQLSKDDDPGDEVEVCSVIPHSYFSDSVFANRKSKLVSKWPRSLSWQSGSTF